MIDVRLVQRAPADADPVFPLEPGPLTPIDVVAFDAPLPRPSFVDLVGQAFVPLAGLHTALDAGQQVIVEHSEPTRIVAASALSLDAAADAHATSAANFGDADPVDVIATTQSHVGYIDAAHVNLDEPPPSPMPVPDPHHRPPKGDWDPGDDTGRG